MALFSTPLSQRVCPVDFRRVELNQITRQPDSPLLNARKSPEQISHHSHHEGTAGTEKDQTGPWPNSHPQQQRN